ncbi:MAG: shikimate dehydrogenase [Woeseia sp.]|nr:shikimate dehydrogenase [Woeseia sp.]|tara:strand:- start:3915 stop:4751 length:837 start_codon:yes stop_codon:yes gene_type:complete
MPSNQPDRYGVIGYPVSHSRSPYIHQLFAKQTDQDIQYDLIEVPPYILKRKIQEFMEEGGKGLNITLPHKSAVAAYVDDMSARAVTAGAVNTLVCRDSVLYGDNTDGAGLVTDLENNQGFSIRGAKILILGAGGATRGIIGPLLQAHACSIVIANRTFQKAIDLADCFKKLGTVTASEIRALTSKNSFNLIINATSAGLKGGAWLYPPSIVNTDALCYDLSYSATPTPFMEWASRAGAAKSLMGWGMLVEQAAESFFIWRGIQPDTKQVLEQLTGNTA